MRSGAEDAGQAAKRCARSRQGRGRLVAHRLLCALVVLSHTSVCERPPVRLNIKSPEDLSIVSPRFRITFEVEGAESLPVEGATAVLLLNNREAVNFTVAAQETPQTLSVEFAEMRTLVYDVVVALMAPGGGGYMGVSAVGTFGVIPDADDPQSASFEASTARERAGGGDKEGKETTPDDVRAALERRVFVLKNMREHAQDIAALMRPGNDDAARCGVCGVRSRGPQIAQSVSELLRLEGRGGDARLCAEQQGGGAGGGASALEALRGEHARLYAVMAEASPGDPAMGMEGTSGQLDSQTEVYRLLASDPSVATVCETGFGAGHSAVTWLHANARVHVHAFDLGELRGMGVGRGFVDAKYPGRLSLTEGDSSWTVPEYLDKHPDLKCDVVHIDGGHFDFTPWNDIVSMARASHAETILLIDDTPSIGDVARAVQVAESIGLLREVACSNAVGYDANTKQRHLRGFCLAQYEPRAIEAVRALEGHETG